MHKSTFFTGQPIFSQLLKFIPRDKISTISTKHNSDRYCKRYNTYDHLVTLLYSILNNCTSLRETTTGLLAWEHRLQHIGLKHHPRRSTLSDANNRRSAVVFEDIYMALLEKYSHFLPDSRSKKRSSLYIFDSTSITLFQEVLRCSGLAPVNGRQKGGIKVHTLIKSDQDVPCFIKFSSAVANDSQFLKELELPAGSVILFDRGYFDYSTFNDFTKKKIVWVTRRRSQSVFKVMAARVVTKEDQNAGVLTDQLIILGHNNKGRVMVKSRLIRFKDTCGKVYEFVTNNLRMSPLTIAQLYKQRWQIEILFKRLKQNYPLKYFLGNSENAIKIQIWCTLIVDLILKLIKNQAAKKWSFSNLAAMIRLHLMTYIDLFAFLRSPERALLKFCYKNNQTTFPLLFDT